MTADFLPLDQCSQKWEQDSVIPQLAFELFVVIHNFEVQKSVGWWCVVQSHHFLEIHASLFLAVFTFLESSLLLSVIL